MNLKLVGKVFEPFVNPCGLISLSQTKGCPNPGLDAEVLSHLLRDINVSYTIYTTEEDFGGYINNTWYGLYGLLMNNTYDSLITSMVITKPRMDSFHATYAVDYLPYAFIVKRFPETFHDSFRLLIEPFSPEMWILQLITLFLFLSAGIIPKLISNHKLNCRTAFGQMGDTAWCLYRYCFAQGKEVPFETNRVSGVIMTLMFFLLLPFSVNLYQNALLSHLYMKYPKPPFNTIDQLVTLIEHGKYQMVSDKNDLSFFEDMDTSSDEFLIRIKRVMDKNLVHYVEDEKDALEHVFKFNYVYPSTLDEAAELIKDRCDFQLVVDEHRTQQLVYLFNKNIPYSYIKKLNSAIGKSWPRMNYYKKKYYLKSLANLTSCQYKQGPSKLTLTNLGGVIYISLFSVLLAWIIFIAEIVQFKRTLCRSYTPYLL